MTTYKYDVFLSYAIEDKIELASELCQKLEKKGLSVWYAGRELIAGESIEKTVREGLSQSRFGIVLITPTYFEKKWTLKELYTLMSMETDGRKVIIPVFHKVTPDEVATYDKVLSDRWALKTSDGLESVASEIHSRIHEVSNNRSNSKGPLIKWLVLFISVLAIAGFISYHSIHEEARLSSSLLKKLIDNRVAEFNNKIVDNLGALELKGELLVTDKTSISESIQSFDQLERQYRNFYYFTNDFEEYQFRKYVEPACDFDFDVNSQSNNYGFEFPNLYMIDKEPSSPYYDKEFFYFNTQPVTYVIDEIIHQDTIVLASVTYREHVRLLSVHIEYTASSLERKNATYTLKGLLPTEIFVFKPDSKGWIFSHIE